MKKIIIGILSIILCTITLTGCISNANKLEERTINGITISAAQQGDGSSVDDVTEESISSQLGIEITNFNNALTINNIKAVYFEYTITNSKNIKEKDCYIIPYYSDGSVQSIRMFYNDEEGVNTSLEDNFQEIINSISSDK